MHGSSSRQDGHASLWRPEAEAHVRLSVAIDPSARGPLACLAQGAQILPPVVFRGPCLAAPVISALRGVGSLR